MVNLLPVLVLLCSFTSLAEEVVVVTADRTATPLSQTASSIQVITAKDIKESNARDIHQILNNLTGMNAVQSGSAGGSTSLFIRGTESRHVLVIIDGIEMNDPSEPSRRFDFSRLSVADIERIEVLKGSQSVLYGSDAIGGVISITTKSGEKKRRTQFGGRTGSHNEVGIHTNTSGTILKTKYSLGAQYLNTDGFSTANKLDGNVENDGQELLTFNSKFSGKIPSLFDWEVSLRAVDDQTDLENGFPFQDDENDRLDTTELYKKVQLKRAFFDGLLESTLAFSANRITRKTNRTLDSTNTTNSLTVNDGRILKFSLQNDLLISKAHTTTFGLEYEKEEAEESNTLDSTYAETKGVFLHHKVLYSSFFTSVGVRLEDHQLFGTQTTYKIAPGYLIKKTKTKLRTSYSTGFKSPSINQLFASGGNRELKPEESRSFEAGFDQAIGEKTDFHFTYFDTILDQRFSTITTATSPFFSWVNSQKAKIKGAEFSLSTSLIDNLVLTTQYTRLVARNLTAGRRLARRPNHQARISAGYQLTSKLNLEASALYLSERDDSEFSANINPSYTIFGVNANYQASESTRTWLRIDNLFDKEYEEISGFGIPGQTFNAGFDTTF